MIKAKRTLAIALKETRHILRDPFTIAMAMGLPLVYILFFGAVIDFNYKNIQIAVQNRDKTPVSRNLIETFSFSGYFIPKAISPGETAISALSGGRTSATLIIEPNFAKNISAGKKSEVQLLIDGADNSKAGVVLGYLPGIEKSFLKKIYGSRPDYLELKTKFFFNPELNSKYLIVPGLAVVLTGLISILLTALTVAREWENGSMELLLSTPVKPLEIVAGKLLPYFVLSFMSALLVYVCARLLFGIPFKGSLLLYFAGYTLFAVAALAQGLVISVVTRQQQIAMQLAIVSGLLPSLLLSGFIFPIESMPWLFQVLTNILSQRWFIVISRAVFLKGSSFSDLLIPFFALLTISFILIFLAIKKFKTDLE